MLLLLGTGENNYYNDSDFYSVICDTEKRKIYKVITHSTRGAGYHVIDTVQATAEHKELIREISTEQANSFLATYDDLIIGDTVKVYKGRKFPIGTTGTIKKFSEYKDRYNRVQGTYAVTENGYIPKQNLELIQRNTTPEQTQFIIDQLLSFGEVSYTYALN